jgi:predicted ArsR family transcriptional regulator
VAGEIESASRRRALAEARGLVATALTRAQQLGLRGEALRAHVDRLIEQEEESQAAAAAGSDRPMR